MSQLELARQQLIGFTHASQGFSAKSLAEGMGLTRREWLKLRDDVVLKPTDKQELDDYFKC